MVLSLFTLHRVEATKGSPYFQKYSHMALSRQDGAGDRPSDKLRKIPEFSEALNAKHIFHLNNARFRATERELLLHMVYPIGRGNRWRVPQIWGANWGSSYQGL